MKSVSPLCTDSFPSLSFPVSQELREAVVSGYDITPEAALAKMVWTLRTFPDQKTRKAVGVTFVFLVGMFYCVLYELLKVG